MIWSNVVRGILLNCLAPLIIVAQTSSLGQGSNGPAATKDCVDRIFRLWQWEKYWQGTFPGEESYRSGERSRMVGFSYRSICGLCSAMLGICQMYTMDQFGVPVMLNQEKIAREADERAAAKKFVGQGIASGHLWRGPLLPSLSRTAPSSQAAASAEGISGLPRQGAAGNAAMGLKWEDFWSDILEVILPPMTTSAAIAGKIRPLNLGGFERDLREIFSERPVTPQCSPREVIIPYFSPEDPSVEVLVRDGKCRETAVTMVRDAITGKWETGGWSDKPAYLDRYKSRILSAEMDRLTIR